MIQRLRARTAAGRGGSACLAVGVDAAAGPAAGADSAQPASAAAAPETRTTARMRRFMHFLLVVEQPAPRGSPPAGASAGESAACAPPWDGRAPRTAGPPPRSGPRP